MRNYYSDPTGNTAIGAVDREFRKLEKEAKGRRLLQKQKERRHKRYAESRKLANK